MFRYSNYPQWSNKIQRSSHYKMCQNLIREMYQLNCLNINKYIRVCWDLSIGIKSYVIGKKFHSQKCWNYHELELFEINTKKRRTMKYTIWERVLMIANSSYLKLVQDRASLNIRNKRSVLKAAIAVNIPPEKL